MSDNNKLYVFNDTETTGLNTWYSQIIQIGSVLSDENFDVIEELARMKGYEGEACHTCQQFTMVRNGSCLKCASCGSTSGCS